MRGSEAQGRAADRVAVWLAPAALTAYLLGVAWATATSVYAPVDLLMLAALYALLALALHAACLLALRLWTPLGVLAALGVGAVLVWHLREQTSLPQGAAGFAGAAAALGGVYAALLWRARAGRLAPAALLLAGSGALFGAGLVAGFQGSNTFRWHLLRHNKLMGTPAYYLLAEPVEVLRSEIWEQHTNGPEPRAAAPRPLAAAAPGRRPNLVVLLLDTLRADALSAYGGDATLMPELERFAAGSVVFRDVLSNAAWTRPSVASLFTGLLAEQHGAVDRMYRLPDSRRTLAESLAEEGYLTAAFVSNFAAVGRDAGFGQGFADFFEVAGGPHPYARAEQVNAAVADWLAAHGGATQPLFLYVHYLDPHQPYLSDVPDSPRAESFRRAYQAEVRHLDRGLGEFFELLERALPEPPIVFVISDHGEEFGEHGEGGHGHSLYREVVRLLALLRAPGTPPQQLSTPLESRDFFELLLALSQRPGLDVASWARERARERRYTSSYVTTPSSPHRPYLNHILMRGIEADGLYLIWSGYGSSYELYDLERDPGQTRNLAREQPERVRELQRLMDASTGPWTRPVPVEMREDTVRLLRDLGYVE